MSGSSTWRAIPASSRSAWTREIAAEYFEATKVLKSMLGRAGV
ncbi:MAG: hypothetical protein NTV08_14115 [Verrucomicrobia bacterium]|nr:hypothetical protein [Verrucomicrobiota bacterium]